MPALLSVQRPTASRSCPLLEECADYRKEAATLFNNIRVPAALVNSASVQGAFALTPLPGDPVMLAAAKRLYVLLAICAIGSELLAIVTATVAINKLSEVSSAPTPSVVKLLLSPDYEFSWVSVNVQFFSGLFGLAAMVLMHVQDEYRSFVNFSELMLKYPVMPFYLFNEEFVAKMLQLFKQVF